MAHSTSFRTEDRDDGYVKAWYTVDDVEYWIGFFADNFTAQTEIDQLIAAAQARWED